MNQVTSENLIATKQKIFDLDLEPLKVKLQSVSEGPGWTLRKCDEVEFFYKNFATCHIIYSHKYFLIFLIQIIDLDISCGRIRENCNSI